MLTTAFRAVRRRTRSSATPQFVLPDLNTNDGAAGAARSLAADTAVLCHIARSTRRLVSDLNMSFEQPKILENKDSSGRTHRFALYRAELIESVEKLGFVGFFSEKWPDPNAKTVDAIARADALMLGELTDVKDVLVYSSMELPNGDWANLVVRDAADDQSGVTASPVHKFASSILSPDYYAAIRIHMGTFEDNELTGRPIVNETRQYRFDKRKAASGV